VPLPGETALIAASILAARGHYSIVSVIVVAALAAIIGDNIGYWIGRTGGRALLERWGPLRRYSARALPPSERFFEKHGGKTVFIGRFVAVLRVTAAWLAGITHMPWWRFFLWNAAGGIAWATTIGLLAYYFGKAAADAVQTYGIYALIAIVVLVTVGFIGMRLLKKRYEPT
jgi:membrane protein DedA with SNARE-associated domain